MANVNQKIVRAPKVAGDTKETVRVSLTENFEDFRIAGLFDRGDQWEALLEKPLDKISSRIRIAEFPPAKKEPVEEGGSEEPSEEAEEESEPSEDKGGEKSEKKPPFGGDEEGGEDGKQTEMKAKDPLQEAVHLLKELQNVFKGLADKSKLVDEFHEKSKPHVPAMDGMGGPDAAQTPDEIGPAMPGAEGPGAGAPPSPGMPGDDLDPNLAPGEDRALKSAPKAPPVPRRPQPAQGFDRRRKTPGMPMGFGNTQHKVVFHPISDGQTTYSIVDAASGLNQDARYASYRVESITEDIQTNRFIAKLTLK